jgi:hypothetical protein
MLWEWRNPASERKPAGRFLTDRALADRFLAGRSTGLVEFVQVFAGFEADGAAWSDADFGSGTRVAAYSGFARTDVEDAEAAQLDAVSLSERALQAFKDCFDGGLGFYAGQSGTLNYLVYDVLLNQWLPPETRK